VSVQAIAVGGNGGFGQPDLFPFPPIGGIFGGGAGGSANANASAIGGDSVSVQAIAVGGNGGVGQTFDNIGSPGGAGGSAIANSAGTATRNGVNVTSTANATGGTGGTGTTRGADGSAIATASASAVGSGVATANASALGSSGAATATSSSSGGLGKSVVASATSPVGGPASAFTQTTFGGGVSLPTSINPGQSYSVVNGFVGGPLTLALGAMGAGYGGSGESLTYQESADFQLGGQGTILLGFLNPISIGNGFDSSTFEIFVDGGLFLNLVFPDLASANDFFSHGIFDLGQFSGGVTDVELLFSETMSSTQGFGFTYAFTAAGFSGAVPEPSTWVMLLLGFAGLGFAFRRSRRKAAFA
jgi:hypothetical protein